MTQITRQLISNDSGTSIVLELACRSCGNRLSLSIRGLVCRSILLTGGSSTLRSLRARGRLRSATLIDDSACGGLRNLLRRNSADIRLLQSCEVALSDG